MTLLQRLLGISVVVPVIVLWLPFLLVTCHNVPSVWHHHPPSAMEMEDISYEVGEIPVEGAVTMAFVFDITGSMYDDLVQVIEGASRILDTMLQRRDRLLHNYVLVPFHDPDVGPATVTTDHHVFLSHLRELYVQGGGDCPEASIAAIKLALEVCLPNSFIYVFTDASSKDYHLLQDVLTLIQRKQSQVVFVMTGDCGDPSHPGFQAYERIASTSSGQVFLLEKSDVEEVLNFVRVSLQARKVNLLAVDTDKGGEASWPLIVDPRLKEITISLSGESSKVELVNPLGSVVDEDSGLKDLLNLSNVQVVNVKDPQTGTWNVKVGSNSSHTIRATGLSPVDFVYGFSTSPTNDLQETYHRPLKGALTYLLINITDIPDGAIFKHVDLVSLSGITLANVPLTSTNSSNKHGIYNGTPFIPPDDFFYLKISGVDENGLPIERISPTAVSSQLPDIPEVILRSEKNVHHGNTIHLNCYIQSLVPFTVKWMKGENQEETMKPEKTFLQTSDDELMIVNVTSHHEGYYHCIASNIAGTSSSQVYLDIKERPPKLDKLENVTTTPGMDVSMICSVQNHLTVPFNLTWARYDPAVTRRRFVTDLITTNPRITDHGNGKLTVSNVQTEDEGWFRCTARNEGGSSHQRLYLAVQLAPHATISPREVTLVSGTNATILCESIGVPTPFIEWLRDGQLVHNSNTIYVAGGKLQLTDAGPLEEGSYECHAHNIAGSDSQIVTVKYLEAPVIVQGQEIFRVILGAMLNLPCKLDTRFPAAQIYWSKTGSNLNGLHELSYDLNKIRRGDLPIEEEILENGSENSFVVLRDGGLRFKVGVTDGGEYICTAENKVGKDRQKLSLIVLIPPSKPVIPTAEATVIALRGMQHHLSCLSSGYPAPKITWFKNDLALLSTNTSNHSVIVEDELGILLLSDLRVSDAGSYSCVAQNEAGKALSDQIKLVVYDPPVIEQSDAGNMEVIVGRDIIIPCPSSGYPPPLIFWQQDGIALDPATLVIFNNGSLLVHDAKQHNAGTYRCTASNIAGFDHKDIKLSVLIPPSINPSALHMKPEALEGGEIVLSCPVDAIPPPTITWFKDNEVVADRSDISMQDSGRKLHIGKVRLSDAGTYICLAINAAGETRSAVALDVLEPPTFEFDDYDPAVSIVEWSTLELECSAKGYPIPSITWYKDGISFSHNNEKEVNNQWLTIQNVQADDTASYTCKVKNKVGFIERHFSVNVLIPPTLRGAEYEVKKVLAGNEVNLECQVDGSPLPTISWIKEDIPMEQLLHPMISLSPDGSSLKFLSVAVADSGEYICEAVNQAGMTAKTATLDVMVAPIIQGSNVTKVHKVLRGRNITLICTVSGIPSPIVSWQKDGLDISTPLNNAPVLQYTGQSQADLPNQLVQHQHSLSVDVTDVQDGGQFSCKATNVAGIINKDFVVEVMVPPYFNVTSGNMEEFEKKQSLVGSSVVFYCPALGHPQPSLLWLKDDLPLGASSRFEIIDNGQLLQILTGLNEAGNYSCVASNEAGSSKIGFQLDVIVPPSIQTPLSGRDVGLMPHRVILGDKFVLNCPVTGQPLPVIEWSKDGIIISPRSQRYEFGQKGQSLIVSQATNEDAGKYVCVARNSAGSAEKAFPVVVQRAPKLKVPLSNIDTNVTIIVNQDTTLHCPIDGDPTPSIIWMKDGEVKSANMTLIIHNATVEDSGIYTCYAMNDVGETELEFNINVQEPPKINHDRAISKQNVIEDDHVTIECPVHGHPSPGITWLHNGHLLQYEEGFGYEDHSRILIVYHVHASHAGQYTCIAANEAGAIEHSIMLNVQVPPRIENSHSANEELSILQHRQMVVYCPIVGSPPLSIMWFKNDQPLHLLGDGDIIVTADGKRLKLRNAQVQHTGTYKCVGVNEAGKTIKEFKVQVLVPPRVHKENRGMISTHINTKEGETVHLNCNVSGIPEPTILWLKEGNVIIMQNGNNTTKLDESELITIIESHFNNVDILHAGHQLRIISPIPRDGGHYTCIASNIAGTTEKNFYLEILVSPKIDGPQHEKKKVRLNRPVILECPVQGNPLPNITWTKNGEVVKGLHYGSNGQQLYLAHSSVTDAGYYSCIAISSVGSTEKSFELIIQVPPKILLSKKNFVAMVGEDLILQCISDGHPAPTISWIKDGTLLTDTHIKSLNIVLHDNNQKLELKNITVDDRGHFMCLVSNEAGIDEEYYNLQVIAPPVMRALSTNELHPLLHINQSITLECPVLSDDILQIVWYKNKQTLDASADPFLYERAADYSLQLIRVRREDAGLYECVASNSAGKASTEFHLEVFVPPKIESPLSDDRGMNHVLHHQIVDFECYVTGYPEPTVTWFKNGHALSNVDASLHNVSERHKILSSGQHLRIENVEVNDTGQYTCTASSTAGSAERDFHLMVQVPPQIDHSVGKNYFVIVHQPITLPCVVQGFPEPSVKWNHNGIDLNLYSNPSIKASKHGLHIQRSRKADEGQYVCAASNSAGKDDHTFIVHVYIPPVIDRSNMVGPMMVVENHALLLNCPASGHPLPTIKWAKDGFSLDEVGPDRIQFLKGGLSLHIANVQQTDGGMYECVAFNDAGQDMVEQQVDILIPPRNKENSAGHTIHRQVLEGKSTTITCTVSGDPLPQIFWMKNGQVFDVHQNNFHANSDQSSIKIIKAQPVDSGRYTCVASNTAGDIELDTDLEVLVPPTIQAIPESNMIEIVIGYSLALECVPHGVPLPDIIWFHNGIPVSTLSHVKLAHVGHKIRVESVQLHDSGNYTCVASNDVGISEHLFNVAIVVPPTINETLLALNPTVMMHDSITLVCPVYGIPIPRIAWFHETQLLMPNENIHLSNTGKQLTIKNARLLHRGNYTCSANNVAGSIEADMYLNVWVLPEIRHANVEPETVTVISGQPTVLECEMRSAIPIPSITWWKNDDTIYDDPLQRIVIGNNGQILNITHAHIQDEGNYFCVVENEAGVAEKEYHLDVIVPPGFVSHDSPKIIEVIINNPIIIECPVSGDPLPLVTWLKNKMPLMPTERLHFLHNGSTVYSEAAFITDSGDYTCVAANEAGVIEKEFAVFVHVPPTMNDANYTQNVSVITHQSLRLECPAGGTPRPSVHWTNNGNRLNTSTNDGWWVSGSVLQIHRVTTPGKCFSQCFPGVAFLDFDNLCASPVLSHHEGMYICNATNVAGSTTKGFHVVVWYPPYLRDNSTVPNKEVYRNHRENVSLSCHSGGYPTPQITWHKEFQPVTDDEFPNVIFKDNRQELHILDSKLTDEGMYQCTAFNIAGNVSQSFNVKIMVPPSIRGNQDVDMQVVINQRTDIGCDVSGHPEPVISWIHNGSILAEVGTNHHITHDGVLSILIARIADEGLYICHAENDAGFIKRNISLQVLVPPIIADGASNVVVSHHQDTLMSCTVKGRPFPGVSWHRNGEAVQFSKSFTMLPDGSLFIKDTNPDHSGTYTCTARNTAGTKSVQRHLRVNVPPIVNNNLPFSYKVIRGHDIVLECSSQGIPAPQTVWQRSGSIIDLDHNHHYSLMSNGGLNIQNVQSSDSGTYSCSVSNEAGTDHREVQLTVMTPPKIGSDINYPNSNIAALQGSTIPLKCPAEGYPPPDIIWKKNGKTISNQQNIELNRIQMDDSGTYVCVATNEVGRDHKEISLEVLVPPMLTLLPSDRQIVIGEKVEFSCHAEGVPIPNITWLHDGVLIPDHSHSEDGRSVLSLDVIQEEDGGTYTCLATNNAGEKHADASLKILIPPKIIRGPGSHSIKRDASLILPCDVDGDPFPKVIWTKDGHRITHSELLLEDTGWLLLNDIKTTDSGLYKCIATNMAGMAEANGLVTVLEAPFIVVKPHDIVVKLGDSVTMDCVAQGNPPAVIQWFNSKNKISNTDGNSHFLFLRNGSLHLSAVQIPDEDSYKCIAMNDLGSAHATAKITVQVDGMWNEWTAWKPCSTTCGQGLEVRKRTCGNPPPRHGGMPCSGANHESRLCQIQPCPVQGSWSSWQSWSECSVTCGHGSKSRIRLCDAPAPAYGGSHCGGQYTDTETCTMNDCPVNGDWGMWTLWGDCSVSCGKGTRKRTRECNNPVPQHGGRFCNGSQMEAKQCHSAECEVHGMWGSWSLWTSCSHSCGGGKRLRTRQCDSPKPANGGQNCTGQHTQTDYCHNEPCPVHGNWAPWSLWGECSASCNGGQRKRFRTCNNPQPSNGGRSCPGNAQDVETCAAHRCPEHGGWSLWNEWSSCTSTCGPGTRRRLRSCTEPSPRFGGMRCTGDDAQVEECSEDNCYFSETDLRVIGNLLGVVNGIQIGLSQVTGNITHTGTHNTLVTTIGSIPPDAGSTLRVVASMLSSIQWAFAQEFDQAINGYSLTNGYFIMDTYVLFATGEMLTINHVSQGLDDDDNLLVDIVLSGDVPEISETANITFDDYTEYYVQAGTDTLYAQSSRTFHVGRSTIPYAWNHSVKYDENMGMMPYLVQQLNINDISIHYEPSTEELRVSVTASITKGSPSNQCPLGFFLDFDGTICEDLDECSQNIACSHGCSNSPGSYSCFCPPGYILGSDGHNCQDVDECQLGVDDCFLPEECENTVGSYQCLATCRIGFQRDTSRLECQDIDECSTQPDICDHNCMNVIGSYRCDCDNGYRLISESTCADIDECEQMENPCSHKCRNTPGSFLCECPKGFFLQNSRQCIDYDECLLGDHMCHFDQECHNTVGSYRCINTCPSGFTKQAHGSCSDIDECQIMSVCHSSQSCENTHGSYRCVCPQGLKSKGPGHECEDFNECLTEGQCQHECENTKGSYVCYCPQGYRLDENGRNCHDVDECLEDGMKCDADELCFNTRGSFHCVEAPCPSLYEWDPVNRYCILPCDRSDVPCPPGVKYTESLAYKTVALTSGIRAFQDLIQLIAYDQDGRQMPYTVFHIAKDAEGASLFRIRQNGGKGVLHATKALTTGENFETKVVATSYDATRTHVEYVTTFLVYISVSEYPY